MIENIIYTIVIALLWFTVGRFWERFCIQKKDLNGYQPRGIGDILNPPPKKT